MERRWALSLEGHSFDLEDAELLFGQGGEIEVAPVTDLAGFKRPALFASAFGSATAVAAVHELGKVIVDRLNGIMFVRDPSRQPITIDAVLGWQPAEPTKPAGFVRYALLAGGASVRSKAGGTLNSAGQTEELSVAPRPPEVAWLSASFDDVALEDVLTYLRGVPDWFAIWKAFEIMQADVQERMEAGPSGKRNWWQSGVAWPSKEEVGRFRGSVNYHRHSRVDPSWRMDPAERMSLSEAQHFLAGLVAPWQAWRSAA